MPVEYIELTKDSRLMVMEDPAPLDPRLDSCVTGCYTPPSWWGHRTEGPLPVHDFPGNIVVADDKFSDREADHVYSPDDVVQRWAWLYYGILVERHGNTYWYCDRVAFENIVGLEWTRENQHDVIAADLHAYERWKNREAKIYTLQRKATFKRVTRRYHEKQEDLLEVWEDVDAIGDMYAEDYTPAQAALDYFPLHRREKTVITAMIDQAMADERTLS